MFWFWHRRREAKQALASAEQEKARSQRMRDDTMRDTVGPLTRIHERNRFSDIIRDALLVGYEGKEGK